MPPHLLLLAQEREPGIHAALRFGSLLENVCFDEDSREVDYDASTITENTRAAYPIEYMGEWMDMDVEECGMD